VSMDAWVALDRKASDLAIQAMFPASEPRTARTRYREARSAWRGRGGDRTAWAEQYASMRVALPQVPYDELGVVAFSNYVLGFGFVRSDLTLQGATSLAEALRDVDPARVEVRAAPVVIERSRGGDVWHADASRMEPLRQSLAMAMRPPETDKLVTVRKRAARVLVVAPLPRTRATQYAAEVRRRLARSAGGAIEVPLVAGTDDRLAFRAARELDRRPALAVLVAPAAATDATETTAASVATVCAMLRNRGQEAVVSGPLPVGGGGAASSSTSDALETAVIDGSLPVSWLPAAGTGTEGAGGARRALVAAARANVQTLVRACWPGALAPSLSSTRLRFAFVEARHTGVGVVGASDVTTATVIARLRLWGFSGSRLTLESGGWQPHRTGPSIFYRPGARAAAESLAGDLGLSPKSVVRTGDSPRKVVLSLAD
jgi:hypothetical protein